MTASADDLPRAVGFLGSMAIVVGTIIGSGIFLVPHEMAGQVGSLQSLMMIWAVGGVLSLAGALSLAELGAALPAAGGVYVYLRHAYGRLLAFLYGWAALLVIETGSIATLAVAFGIYSASFMPLTEPQQKLVASAAIVLLSGINILGVRKGAAIQMIFTVAKLSGLTIIVAFALLSTHVERVAATRPLPTPHTTFSSFGVALISALWAYQGWHNLSYAAGEVKDPARVLPRSYLLGTVVVVVAYLGANLAYLRVLPLEVMADDRYQRVAARAMEVLAGPRGARFVSALILCSIFGALNGNILCGARVMFAMGRDGTFFSSLGRVHRRFATPALAIVVQGIWALLLTITGSYKQLYTYVIFTGWVFYAAAVMGLIVLRRSYPELSRPYRVPAYPLLPIAFAMAALVIVGNTLARSPVESGMGLIIVVAGVPIYAVWQASARARTRRARAHRALRGWP